LHTPDDIVFGFFIAVSLVEDTLAVLKQIFGPAALIRLRPAQFFSPACVDAEPGRVHRRARFQAALTGPAR
jgi:hypothetical protein